MFGVGNVGVPLFKSSLATSLGFTGTGQAVQLFQHITQQHSGELGYVKELASSLNTMYHGIKDLAVLASKGQSTELEPGEKELVARHEMFNRVEAMRVSTRGQPLIHRIGNYTYRIHLVRSNRISVESPGIELHIRAELPDGSAQPEKKYIAFVTEDGEIAIQLSQADAQGAAGGEQRGQRIYGTVVQAVADLIVMHP